MSYILIRGEGRLFLLWDNGASGASDVMAASRWDIDPQTITPAFPRCDCDAE